MSYSGDSLQRPLSDAHYSRAPNPANPSERFLGSEAGVPPRKRTSPWIKVGIPVAVILIVVAVVVGAVVGTRSHHNSQTSSNPSGPAGSGSGSGPSSGGNGNVQGVFATATDSYFLPVYPTQANNALYVVPSFVPAASATAAWPADTFTPAVPEATAARPDRPRLFAPSYKWAALPDLIEKDAYLKSFHNRILNNASQYIELPVVQYFRDGGSGILDVAREIKQRVKAYSYAYRMTNDSKWLNSAWAELQHAANNGPSPFSMNLSDPWNKDHFLDVAELTAAFAIGYDWLYDAWTTDQRTSLMWTIINNGLNTGLAAYNGASYGWWTGRGEVISGNWNCVSNGGMVLGALAILNDDPTGVAEQVIGKAIPNAQANCVKGPSSDGSWTETPNYWYFGTTGHAEMTSALMSATGSDYGLLGTNPNFNLTGLYHIYVTGMTSLFDYGDHGPNKYSSTANSMMFYATAYNTPAYMLHQRDRFDAADPISMFWYDPTVTGAWWNGLALDHQFSDPETYWVSMRSSWTDNTGTYIAMKSSKLTGHQTHGDLDCGDFVLDAMGQRWAGELGSGNYLADEYFNSEADDATRWLYYRKRTEGQNTLLIGAANELAVEAAPTFVSYQSSNTVQNSDPVLQLSSDSSALAVTDMSSAYGSGSTVVRGIRFLNGRKQVLLQDDVTTNGNDVMWRMHTNATVTANGATATLRLNGKTLQASILSPSGVSFATMTPTRLPSDPPLPAGPASQDQENRGVTVLVINVPAGTNSIQVLFNPQWDGFSASDFVTPKSVPLSEWSLTSHS